MLDERLQNLWDAYLVAERDRVRQSMMLALDRFIDALLESPPDLWKAWAKQLAEAVSDRGAETLVRFPLFRRVLLPALAEGVRQQEPHCARWLASFEALLLHSPTPSLPPHLRTAVGLLNEALRLNPADTRARKGLIQRHAWLLEYSLHELPDGVLYGPNAASLKECEELLSLLHEFKHHVALTNQQERYAELLEECEYHYPAYARYLQTRQDGEGYELFLLSATKKSG